MRRFVETLLRRLRTPPTLERILGETVVVLVAHFVLLWLLARTSVLAATFAPEAETGWLTSLLGHAFLLLRIFVFVLLPGMFAVRVWLFVSRPPWPPRHW